MKEIFTTIISGPDQPAIISSPAHETRELGGEWLIVKVIKLDNQFTAIARTTIDQEGKTELKDTLNEKFPSLCFHYEETTTKRQPPTATIMLAIDCLDRPGLTQDISDFLTGLDIRIENMESTRHPIGAVTSTVYSTMVTLSAPRELDGKTIAARIEALTGDIKVKVL